MDICAPILGIAWIEGHAPRVIYRSWGPCPHEAADLRRPLRPAPFAASFMDRGALPPRSGSLAGTPAPRAVRRVIYGSWGPCPHEAAHLRGTPAPRAVRRVI